MIRPDPRGAALALLLAALACGRPEPRPNILIVTLDTLRYDRLDAYVPDDRDITPRQDALAAESVLFEQAFASSSFTPPSHASLLTGLFPSEHGLTHWKRRLADVPTAAGWFAARGYRTAAFTPMRTLFVLGLDRGFQHRVSPPHRMQQGQVILADGAAVNGAALPWLTRTDHEPFFAWVHYYDAHRPYAHQGPEWARRFGDGDLALGAQQRHYRLTPAEREQLQLTPEQTRFLKDRYDGGVAYLDTRVGELVEGLRQAGVLEHTLLVVTADHGEVLDEHDEEWFSHDPYLYEENVRVPLLLRLPGGERGGSRVPALAASVDVWPTLIELAGLDPEGLRPSGASLAATLEGGPGPRTDVLADRAEALLPTHQEQGAAERLLMLRTATHKLLWRPDQLRTELYAVDDEHTGLLRADSERGKALMRILLQRLGDLQEVAVSGAGLDEQTQEQLQALGYLGER